MQFHHLINIDKIINVGTNADTSESSKIISSKFKDFLYYTVGVHPHDAGSAYSIKDLEALSNEAVAIGECGIDTTEEGFNEVKLKKQIETFDEMIDLSNRKNLPLIIHCRGNKAFKVTLERVKNSKVKNIVMHSFTGRLKQSDLILNKGIFMSFNGICTFKNAEEVRKILSIYPLELMLAETDSPFLTPHPFRGKQNDPSFIKLVYEKIAEVKRLNFEETVKILDLNALAFFRM